jgi:hypothetical protein
VAKPQESTKAREGHLQTEGILGCKSRITFTGGAVEAVLAAVTWLVDARALLAREAEATEVSEV